MQPLQGMEMNNPITVKQFYSECGPCFDAIALVGVHVDLHEDASFNIINENYIPVSQDAIDILMDDSYYLLRVCELSYGPGGNQSGIVLIVGGDADYRLWKSGLTTTK